VERGRACGRGVSGADSPGARGGWRAGGAPCPGRGLSPLRSGRGDQRPSRLRAVGPLVGVAGAPARAGAGRPVHVEADRSARPGAGVAVMSAGQETLVRQDSPVGEEVVPVGRRLGVAVIGCGLIGRRRAACAAAHAGTQLVAVVDVDRSRSSSLATEYGGDVVDDWRLAVARPDVDAVVVATPNGYLAEIGCAALEQGKHVLLEKPMGRGLAEAERLAAAAASSGRLLKIGFNHRYHPGLERLFEVVGSGGIG